MATGKHGGNGGQGTYAPLSWRDRLKIRAATRHLHSRFTAVRAAAHKEIARILKRRQQSRLARLHPKNLAKRAWQRANYGKLHKCLDCGHQERGKDAFRGHLKGHMREAGRSRGRDTTPGTAARQHSRASGAEPWRWRGGDAPSREDARAEQEYTAQRQRLGRQEQGVGLRSAGEMEARWQGAHDEGVREGRERARQAARRPAPDIRQQAGLIPQQGARTNGQPPRRAQAPSPVLHERRDGRQPASPPTGREKFERAAAPVRSPRTPSGPEYGPAAPSGPSRGAPLPSETVRTPSRSADKRPWTGLRKRTRSA
jgi:hypothetical protein